MSYYYMSGRKNPVGKILMKILCRGIMPPEAMVDKISDYMSRNDIIVSCFPLMQGCNVPYSLLELEGDGTGCVVGSKIMSTSHNASYGITLDTHQDLTRIVPPHFPGQQHEADIHSSLGTPQSGTDLQGGGRGNVPPSSIITKTIRDHRSTKLITRRRKKYEDSSSESSDEESDEE